MTSHFGKECSGTEAFWVLVIDSTGSAHILVDTVISTVLFGTLVPRSS